jgi:UDP-2-acetamido-3-amino-2,3-dideoxy-glucuronate N-acetyltransferase
MKTSKTSFIHPTAIVEDNVSVGERSNIWHHCHLRQGCSIEEDVSLGKGVFIDSDVIIKKGSRIQNGVSIYKGVIVKEWVFIGPNVTFTNDVYPRAGAKSWKISNTILEQGSSLGAGSIVLCDLTIGTFAMIGAGSVLTESIPPFHLAYGLTAKPVSKICACGSTRLDLNTLPKNYIQACCSKNLKEQVITLAEEKIRELE